MSPATGMKKKTSFSLHFTRFYVSLPSKRIFPRKKNKMEIRANCKINLGLNIMERRKDGYHNIETVFYPVPLADTLQVTPSEHDALQVGTLRLDPERRTVHKDNREIDLTVKEFDLLELLMRSPGKVFSREMLLNTVWGYDYQGEERTVDVHVRRLREKLESDPANPVYLVTKWGVGYYFKG